MKCPNCGREVEKGNLFCTHCLAEIPWVQEYNSVETLMKKKKMEEPEDVPKKPKSRLEEAKEYLKMQLSGVHLSVEIVGGLVLCVLIIIFAAWVSYVRSFDENVLYEIAKEAYIDGEYEKALEYAERSFEKNSEFVEAELLSARVLEAQGDYESAVMVMETVIKTFPEHVGAFELYIRLLAASGRNYEAKEVLDACTNKEFLEACSEYISEMPLTNLEEGTYGEVREVTLSVVEDGVIYYTLDGSIPTVYSMQYTSPIILGEGTTVLNAVCINDKNIPSDILTKVYVISTRQPDGPAVLPESGNYYERTKIEVMVPEGYRAFYAFDEVPTIQSTEYVTPITMPEGYHELYVILVAQNGKISEPTRREYYLEY